MATFETVNSDSVPSGTFYPSSNDAVIVNIEPDYTKFNGTNALEINNAGGALDSKINKAGGFTIYALFKPNFTNGVTWYYIYSHNNNSATVNKEVYLRVKWITDPVEQSPNTFHLQFGSWNGRANYWVDVPLGTDFNNKWIEAYGVFDPTQLGSQGKRWQLYIRKEGAANFTMSSSSQNAYEPQPFDGDYLIGAHDKQTGGDARFFNGEIAQVAVFPCVLQCRASLTTDLNNNGYIDSATENAISAFDEETSTYYNALPLPYIDNSEDVPESFRRAPVRVSLFKNSFVENLYYKLSYELYTSKKQLKDTDIVFNIYDTETSDILATNWTNINDVLYPLQNTYIDVELWPVDPDDDGTDEDVEIDVFKARQYAKIMTLNGEIYDVITAKLSVSDRNDGAGFLIEDSTYFYAEGTTLNTTLRTQPSELFDFSTGWKENPASGGSVTTIMTENKVGADGPRTETGNQDNDHAAYTKLEYTDGFTFTFDYKFERNTNVSSEKVKTTGFVQPNRPNEPKRKNKLSFFGNSGVKLGSYKGTGDGVSEVAIIDIQQFVAAVGGVSNLKIIEDGSDPKKYGWTNIDDSFLLNGKNVENEHVTQLMTGVIYKNMDKANIIGGQNKTWAQLVTENLTLWGKQECKMKIQYSNVTTVSGVIKGTLPKVTLDSKLYLQTHWGSGVTFRNMTLITPTPNPSNEQTTTSGTNKTTILTTLFVLLASITFWSIGAMCCFGVVKPPELSTNWGEDTFPFTTHIKVDGKDVELKPNFAKKFWETDSTSPEYEHLRKLSRAKYEVELRDKNLTNIQITRYIEAKDDDNWLYDFKVGILSKIDFTGSDLRHAVISGVNFTYCSFDRTNMVDLNSDTCSNSGNVYSGKDFYFDKSNTFHGATIAHYVGGSSLRYRGIQDIRLFPKQIKQTSNFFRKSLVNCIFPFQRFWGTDFSNFHLSDSEFSVKGGLKDCKFDNATIYGCTFTEISFQQLASTKDFRSGCLTEVKLGCTDFSSVDLSRMILLRCTFGLGTSITWEEYHDEAIETHNYCDFNGTNLSDSVITQCDFEHTKNLTVEQIKSTWNYKQNRMDGIKLPKSIQDELDKEKKK
ncbi:MAG: pentapeptide repeat-containing protein [Planctomycetaceae bacterium]|nr:pentapeptide repeat-containing protein [Planctomycetaceae bacterium]